MKTCPLLCLPKKNKMLQLQVLSENVEEHNETIKDLELLPLTSFNHPHLIKQHELNDLILELNLSVKQAELLV